MVDVQQLLREPRRVGPARSRSGGLGRLLDRVAFLLGSPLLVLLTLALAAIGAVAVYAATYAGLLSAGATPYHYVVRDLIDLVIAVSLAAVVSALGHRTLARFALPVVVLALGALALVLTPLGSRINGANAWFSLGPIQLEPSQLSILAIIVLCSAWLANRPDDGAVGLRAVSVPLGLSAFAVLLILAEPALGLALVMVAVVTTIVLLAGVRRRTLVALVLLAGLAVGGGAALHVVKPYQQRRLSAFVHPSDDNSAGYQTLESLLAIGSGGFSGSGILHGEETNGAFVPEQRTDFIFTVIGEETGFAGSALVVTLLAGVCLTALRIARNASDRLGYLIATGVATWFAVQTFINVGMTLGLMPVTGIPLPFISYGGSGLFVAAAAVGLLCSVAREQRPSPRPRDPIRIR